jgi:hypothetical protein
MAEKHHVLYDETTDTVTVTLPLFYDRGEVDFSICDRAPIGSIKKLVIVGLISKNHFMPFKEQGLSWQRRFVPNPEIDLSGVSTRRWPHSNPNLEALWEDQEYSAALGRYDSRCLLPLHPLKPSRVDFPLDTQTIIRFGWPGCAWDLRHTKTTNLAELQELTNVEKSFVYMPSLEDLVLPENVKKINESMNHVGSFHSHTFPHVFGSCKHLTSIIRSFTDIPLVTFSDNGLKGQWSSRMSHSFTRCHEMTTFKSTNIGGNFEHCLNDNRKLDTVSLGGIARKIEDSLNHCPELTHIDLTMPGSHARTSDRGIYNSFNANAKMTAIAIPPHANVIYNSFRECPLLKTVDFSVDFVMETKSKISSVKQVRFSFHKCGIEIVTNFEHTRVTQLDSFCFGENPLQYIAVPSTTRNISNYWANNLTQATQKSHLDLSRLHLFQVERTRFQELVNPNLTVTPRGFDNVWITRMNVDNREFSGKELLTLLSLFTDTNSTVHCAFGQDELIKTRMENEPVGMVVFLESALHVPGLRYRGSKLASIGLPRMALLSLNDKSSGTAQTVMFAANRPSKPGEVGLDEFDPSLMMTILTRVVDVTAYRNPTEEAVNGGGTRPN